MSVETYSLEEVERLIGLLEHPGPTAPRHLTLLDVKSLVLSSGGDPYWYSVARASPTATENADWTDLVGPIAADSELACALWDFERAVKDLRRRGELSMFEYAVVSLLVMGWTERDIAGLFHSSPGRITHALRGRARRDREGNPIAGERTRGIVQKVHGGMNGHRGGAPRRAPPETPAEASAHHWGKM